MNEQQHELLNRYEEGLRKSITDFLTEQKELEGRFLEVEELNEKWKSSAPSCMAHAVPEIAKYPLVAIAWAMYEGMGCAVLWDKEWNRYESMEDFHTMFCEPTRKCYYGLALATIRAAREAGECVVTVRAEGMADASVTLMVQ